MVENDSTNGFFSGRATRWEYWKTVLSLLMVNLFIVFLTFDFQDDLFFFLLGIYGIVAIIIGLRVTVRRYHDLDMSGWWVLGFFLLGIIPFIGIIAGVVNLILLGFIPGTEGRNSYGPNPLSTEIPSTSSRQQTIKKYKFQPSRTIKKMRFRSPQTQTHASSADIKTRLEELKTLFVTGEISHEEYIAQRERILKEL